MVSLNLHPYMLFLSGKKVDRVTVVNPALQRTSGDTHWAHPLSYETTYNDTFKGENQVVHP